MTNRAWVGDEVHDELAERDGIVSDIEPGGRYRLRPRAGPGHWYAEDPQRLLLLRRRGENTSL